jgi:hypothetical protein
VEQQSINALASTNEGREAPVLQVKKNKDFQRNMKLALSDMVGNPGRDSVVMNE